MTDFLHKPLCILLAEDDRDDRFFFDLALKKLPLPSELVIVEDGEKLITYLLKNLQNLPDVLFLDFNMPKKNGSECLIEIKQNPDLLHLPVILYSTSLHDEVVDKLYKNGAHYYFNKLNFTELIAILNHILTLLVENEFVRPERSGFVQNHF